MKTTSERLQTSPADAVIVINERPAVQTAAGNQGGTAYEYVPWIFGSMGFFISKTQNQKFLLGFSFNQKNTIMKGR